MWSGLDFLALVMECSTAATQAPSQGLGGGGAATHEMRDLMLFTKNVPPHTTCENDANKYLKKIICLQIFFTKLSIEISEKKFLRLTKK